MTIPPHWPVVGVCGYSGSGKTTLIEQIIPLFAQEGLSVAVIKHDAHRLDVDRPGKDSDRFFRAGATVCAHDATQAFARIPLHGALALEQAVALLVRDHDVVLVEGHKWTDLRFKIWLLAPDNALPPPPDGPTFHACLGPGPDRAKEAHGILSEWLRRTMLQTPLRAGILMGGRSTRMGRPKHLLPFEGRAWIERQADVLAAVCDAVCLLGSGEAPASLRHLPQLADAPGKGGPLAGMVAAMRWDPTADWFFVACDMPHITTDAIRWLLGHRAPGRWVLMPRLGEGGQIEPLFAWLHHRMASRLDPIDRPIALCDHSRAALPAAPPQYLAALQNFNHPEAQP